MADKFRKTFPIRITFADGEQPTSNKLTAIAEQARNGQRLIERALGDVWGQSGDSLLIDHPAQIPNVARIIGEAKYLNPAYFAMDRTFVYREEMTARFVGQNEGMLRFRPLAYVGGSSFFANPPETNEYDVVSLNQWWMDTETGRWRAYTPISVPAFVWYTVDPPNTWVMSQKTVPGVIPDPRQDTFTSCRIEKSGSKYYLHLPPRTPLTFDGNETPPLYPVQTPGEELYNIDHSVQDPPSLFGYGVGPIAALTGVGSDFYRYALPLEIQGLSPGDVIPDGYIYLWDQDGNTVIEDITFRIPDASFDSYVLEVESSTYDFDAKATTDELYTSYNDTELTLITCGAPIARSLQLQMQTFLSHSHSNSGSLEPAVSHNNLEGVNPPNFWSEHFYRYPDYLVTWAPSRWNNDVHTSLLSRVGSQIDSARVRDKFNNAMLGHLILANADTSGSESFLDPDCPDKSFRLFFGSTPQGINHGANIYCENGDINFDRGTGGGTAFSFGVDNDNTGHLGLGTVPHDDYVLDIVRRGASASEAEMIRLSAGVNSLQNHTKIDFYPYGASAIEWAGSIDGWVSGTTKILDVSGDDAVRVGASQYVALSSDELLFSATSSLYIGVGSGEWEFESAGGFIPVSGSRYIGSSVAAEHVDRLYVNRIYRETGVFQLHAEDGDIILDANNGDITLRGRNGNLFFGAGGAGGTTRWIISGSTGTLYPSYASIWDHADHLDIGNQYGRVATLYVDDIDLENSITANTGYGVLLDNNSGVTINAGRVVKGDFSSSFEKSIVKVQASSGYTGEQVIGVAAEDISASASGSVIVAGLVQCYIYIGSSPINYTIGALMSPSSTEDGALSDEGGGGTSGPAAAILMEDLSGESISTTHLAWVVLK